MSFWSLYATHKALLKKPGADGGLLELREKG